MTAAFSLRASLQEIWRRLLVTVLAVSEDLVESCLYSSSLA